MANQIKLIINVDDDGSLRIVAKDAKKAAKGLDEVAQSTDRAAKSSSRLNAAQNHHNKLEKGTAQLGMNSTKAFAKQAQTLGGTLVPAYATLAANIFALTAALGALQRAAALQQLKQGLEEVGASAGRNLPFLASQLREITNYAISTRTAMSSVALGISAGFSSKQLKDLTKVAKGASLALGRDMEDAMSRLVRGTAKIEPEILDELGIMVRLDQAAADYAAQLGKTATQLTQFERRQAFLNATTEQGLKKFSEIAETVDPNPYDQLAATFSDLTNSGFNLLNTVLVPIVNILSSNPLALISVLTLFGSTIVSKLLPSMSELVSKTHTLAVEASVAAEKAAASALSQYEKLGKKLVIPDIAPKLVKQSEEALRAGSLTARQFGARLGAVTKEINILIAEETSLAGVRTKAANARKKQIAEEITILRALRSELETLKAAETSRAALSVSSQKTIFKSRATSAYAESFAKIAGAKNPIEGFKTALAGAGIQFAIFREGVSKGLNVITTGFSMATKSAKLLGTAFLQAIPIIGQVIFVISMLWQFIGPLVTKVWDFVTGATELTKAADKIAKSFDSMSLSATRLQRNLESSTDAIENFTKVLRVRVGLLDQLESGFSALADADFEGKNKELNNLFEEMTKIRDVMTGADWSFKYSGASMAELERAYAKVAEEARGVQKSLDQIGDSKAAQQLANQYITSLSAFTDLSADAAEGIANKVDEIVGKVKKGEIKTWSEFVKQLEAVDPAAKKAAAALAAAADANAQFQKELVKLDARSVTPIDNLVTSIQSLNNELLAVAEKGPEAIEAFFREAPDYKKYIDGIIAGLSTEDLVNINLKPEIVLDESASNFDKLKAKAFNTYNEIQARFTAGAIVLGVGADVEKAQTVALLIQSYQKTMIEAKGTMQELAVLQSLIGKGAANMVQSAELKVIIDEQTLQAQKDLLDAQIKTANNTEKETELKRQRQALELKSKILEIERLDIAVALVNQTAKELDLVHKLNKAMLDVANSQNKIKENSIKAGAAIAGIQITPVEELQIFKEYKNERLQAAEQEYNTTIDRIRAEKELAVLKLKQDRDSAKLAAEQAGKTFDSAPYDNMIKSTEALGTASLAAAEARKREVESTIELDEKTRNRALMEYEINQGFEERINLSKSLESSGADNLAAMVALQVAQGRAAVEAQKAADASGRDLDITLQRNVAENARLNAVKAVFEYQVASYKKVKEIVDLENEHAKEVLTVAENYIKILELARKISTTSKNIEWNVEDDLINFQRFANIRNAQIEEEYRAAEKLANLEFEHRATIIKMQIAERLAKGPYSTADLELELRLVTAIYQARTKSLATTRDIAKEEEKLAKAELARQTVADRIQAALANELIWADKLKALGENGVALTIERAAIMQELAVASTTLSRTEEDSLANLKAINVVEALRLKLLQNQLETEREKVDILKLELDYLREADKAVLDRLKNEMAVSNLLSGRGTGLTDAQDYELAIRSAQQALEMQIQENNLTLIELKLRNDIAKLTIIAAKASVISAMAQIKAANALAVSQGNAPVISSSYLTDLESSINVLNTAEVGLIESANARYEIEKKIAEAKRDQAEQAVIAAKLAGAGNFATTRLAETFELPDSQAFVDAMTAGLSTLQNVSEAAISTILNRPENDAAKLAYEAIGKDITETQSYLDGLLQNGGSLEAIEATKAGLQALQEEQQKTLESVAGVGSAYVHAFTLATAQAIMPFIDSLKQLGPDGEVVAAIAQGALLITDSFATLADSTAAAADKVAAIGNMIGAISSIQKAASAANVAAIDREIEAEKRRDGQSAQSVAKITALEKKKEAQKRKAFEDNKKMMMAQTVVNTASAIMSMMAAPWPINLAMAAIAAAMGAAQLAIISGTSYEGGGAGTPAGPSQISVGERQNTVDLATSRSPSGELAYMRGDMGTGATGANNYMPQGAFTGRAVGGNTAFMVGEQGPELFIPERPGNIIPADKSESMGSPLNVSFSINAIDTQGMQDALMRQRGNIIGMIREAANSHGDFFLENINIREDDAL